MSTLIQDIRFAVRLLIRDRSFTITSLLTLAICIAANTAMFSIVRSVVMKPLPFPDSEHMVLLYNSYPNAGAPRVGAAVPDYFDRLTAVPALDVQAVFRRENMTYGDDNGAERLISLRATPSFFRLVHASPQTGRIFTENEGEPGQNQKVLLSDGFWHRKFSGAPSIIGKTIRLNGNTFEVVGVMPPTFTFLQNDFDVFLPAAFTADNKADNQRHSNSWQMVGRIAAGATIDQVRQQVDALNAHNDTRFPEFHQILKDANFHTVTVFLNDDVVRDVKSLLYLLWGGVLFVLLIGCVNIANLVMVRSSGRTRELATRHAIGADIGRLARQLLTETTLLSLTGGVIGILLGWWALRSVAALNLDQLPRGYEIALDPVGVGVILGLMLIVGVMIGLAPVLRLWRMNLNIELREESRGGSSGRRANMVRRVLATTQVAIALVLLLGAGLLLASFRAVMHLDFGFDPENVATATVNLPANLYKDPAALVTFEQRSLEALRALPDVESAGFTSGLPFSGNFNSNVILAEGYERKPGESLLAPSNLVASAGYFESMHIPVMHGRAFDARDNAGKDTQHTAIVDERLAKKFWPDRDPIGRRLYAPSDLKDVGKITPDTQFFTVVGVVKTVQADDPTTDLTSVGTYYFPYEQSPTRGLTFTVKTRTAQPLFTNTIRQQIAQIDPQLPVFRMQSMQTWIDRALVTRRAAMLIAIAFGVVALFLSSIGIYGVLAYGVVQRRREMGVRMALGGTMGTIFRLVLGDGVKIIGVGLVAGLGLSVAVGQLMKNQLFGVSPLNPLVMAAVTVTLVTIALLASVIPAWRATKINPIVVLGK